MHFAQAKLASGPSISPAVQPAEQWEEMKETKGPWKVGDIGASPAVGC